MDIYAYDRPRQHIYSIGMVMKHFLSIILLIFNLISYSAAKDECNKKEIKKLYTTVSEITVTQIGSSLTPRHRATA